MLNSSDLASDSFFFSLLSSFTERIFTMLTKCRKLTNGVKQLPLLRKSAEEVSVSSAIQDQHCVISPRTKTPRVLFLPISAHPPPPLLVPAFEDRLHSCELIFRTWRNQYWSCSSSLTTAKFHSGRF